MPFQAIADDSGCKGQGPLIVMAGMLGAAEWWADFSDHWDACLHEKPTLQYFKFYDAVHRTGPFAGFSEKSRDNKLIDLARVLDMHPFFALHMTMDLAEHDRALELAHPAPQPRRRKKRFASERIERNSYHHVYSAFVQSACVHLWRQGQREPFEFIADDYPKLSAKLQEWFPVIRAAVPEPFRSIMPLHPITKDDKDFLPLQAADFVAGLQRNANMGASFRWLNSHFTQVRNSGLCRFMGREYFDSIVARTAKTKAFGPPPIDVFIELAKLGESEAISALSVLAEQPPTSEPG
ncbi:MAG: DUF3800 domain-containing protein [Gemmatimonadaceae bacterium]